jgi:hypothetical protein
MTENEDEWIDDEDLLMEAARYAISSGINRNRFMSQSKRAWYEAEAENRGREMERARLKNVG